MYKLVVLCAFFAIAAGKPEVILTAAPYTTLIAPASTTITKQASSVIHPSPLVYSAPLAYTHFIKKRSPQLPLAYSYVAPSTFLATSPLATTYTTPYVQAAPGFGLGLPAATLPIATAHLIKKRAIPLLSTAYVAPAYTPASPLVASAYSAPLISSSPIVASTPLISQPYGFTTHFIKKRSAPILSTYIAPTSYSHQSRIDLQTPWINSYATPLAYSAPIAGLSHIY